MILISESPLASKFLISGLTAAFGLFAIIAMIKNNSKPGAWLFVPKGNTPFEKVRKSSDPSGYLLAFLFWIFASLVLLSTPILVYLRERPL
jgi:hypothetical protein